MLDISYEQQTAPEQIDDEKIFEYALRPKNFSEYIGQENIKDALSIAISAANTRGTSLDHVLFYGPPGLGKTSLAHLLSHELGSSIRITSGSVLQKAGDIAAIITNLQERDILFIDEIHRLPRSIEEILYPAMEDRALDIIVGKGPGARSLRLDLPSFTVIGATTRAGALSQPLRERFGHIHRLEYYSDLELAQIITQSAQKSSLAISNDARAYLAQRARKTPRIANRLLRRASDYALVKEVSTIDTPEVQATMKNLRIDDHGLDEVDRTLLFTIQKLFKGGPVGIETLAAATGEEATTIQDVLEPYLLRLGFIERTNRGRCITERGINHIQFML